MSDDLWLEELLEEPPLPDDGFTARMEARMSRARRLRRLLWTLTAMALASVAFYILYLAQAALPLLGKIEVDATSRAFSYCLAFLLSLGLSGALWLDTEPLHPPSSP